VTAARKAPAKAKPKVKAKASGSGRRRTPVVPDVDTRELAALEAHTERADPLLLTTPPAPEVVPSDVRNVGWVRKSWIDFKRTMKDAASWRSLRYTPYGLWPIGMFAILGIVKSFDGSIFGLVTPDIVRELNISVQNILTVQNLIFFLMTFVALGLAYVLDRVKRVPFVGIGAIVNGIASFFTPHTRSVYTLGTTRMADNVGDAVGTIPDFSLLNDYYPPQNRGRAFALYGTLRRAGGSFAPWLVGLVAINYGWRTPFYITAPLLVVTGIAILFALREPIRGYMERRALGMSEEDAHETEPPVSYGHAWRTIWGVRTLRRLFISDIFGTTAGLMYSLVINLYLAQDYRMDVLDRAKVLTLYGLATLIGGFFGGGIVDSLIRRRVQRVMVFTGILGAVSALLTFGLALRPPLWLLLTIFVFFGFSGALLGPARQVFYGLVIPAHVRTLGSTVFVLTGIPAGIIFQLFVPRVAEWGFTGILFASAPFYLVNALIDISAAGLFERDMRSSISSQSATAEYKRARDAGALKLLVCRDVEVDYDGVQVLFGVDFEAEAGEIIALLGTNGAGKSTLLKAISGVHSASGGAVVYDGRDITHVPAYEVADRGIVHMPGGRGIFPGLTVRENLELGRWTHKDSDDDSPYEQGPLKDVDLDEVLEIFPALRGLMSRPAGALSGGEQQMVSLAQAFLQRPRLLLIDELSLGLSPVIVQQLLESVKAINARGVTIVVVEQSVNVALTLAERAIFMEKGEVKFSGKTKELLARPDILRAVYVKGTGALTSQTGTSPRTRRVVEDRRVVLSVEGLKKSFGGVVAVDDVSFDLHDEEILGLIGPNGAGKTTIFDLISGYQAPDEGRVLYESNDVTKLSADQRARMQLVRRFQDAKLFPSLTVYETLLVALDRRQDVKNMGLIALQLPQARQSERRVRRRADQLIDLLGIGAYRDKFVKELSTGLRRVTDLACVLATEPRVLLLDEPSSGIAQAEAESLGPLLQRVRRETGCSILIIEHDMPLISRVADELIALDQGAVVMRDVPDVVLNDPRVIESYLGTSEAAIRRSGART
jgi:ABC-type branched-subunit amino acid transport system ATPase component/sugar phosphate permease